YVKCAARKNVNASATRKLRVRTSSGTRRSEARRRGREVACDVLAQRFCGALLLDNCRQKERYSSTLIRSLWRAARAESVGAPFRMCSLCIGLRAPQSLLNQSPAN